MNTPQKTETTKEFAENLLYGQQLEFKLPSGFLVKIREQNGADDDILSNTVLAKDLTNIDLFLSSLILDTNLPFSTQGKISKDKIPLIALRDRYFIIFMSRIHSMGEKLLIKYDWGMDNGGLMEYIEDLKEVFIWNFDNDFPKIDSSEYKDTYIKPYINNPYEKLEITLGSGKQLRFKPLNGYSEKELLKLGNEQTYNSELKARGLEQKVNNEWIKVENFMAFTKKDMAELHHEVTTNDPSFEGLVELGNPKTGTIINYPVIASTNFFYPEVI